MGRNMLVDGEWTTDVEPYTDEDGNFDRVETSFRDWIRNESGAQFPPETNRYHLYVTRNCPWAHGAALTRQLSGLTDVVSMDILDPIREDEGWEFSPEKDDCTADSIHGCEYLRDVYCKADPEYTGRVTVPVLWDTEMETIVNNESIEIMRMFATALRSLGDGIDLYPEEPRDDIDRIIDEIYDSINNGVYRAGFAASQEAYDAAVRDVFDALDHWNRVLSDQRYLAGDHLTLADVRIFPTLVRFDYAYHTAFKCNKQYLHQYEYLWPYLRDLYQTPGVADTVNFDHITDQGYYQGQITPIGPDLDFTAPHDRGTLNR